MKAVVFTLGCKVNEVESASIMAAIEGLGWEVSDRLSPADAYVLNTCAVTREAERKSRQLVARAKKYNPDAKIFVCGCASEKDGASFKERGVTFITGARKKQEIIDEFCRVYGGKPTLLPFPKQVKTRAFIKIQDGCNNFCSYCIIPYLRGREISRSIEDILAEIQKTASPEIVLNGINISSYRDGNSGLSGLIRALKDVDKRIRLGSLECNIITDELLDGLRELKDFAPQFHLSLQSGSDEVLRAMNRRYTRADYLEKCAKIYSFFPDAAITTDIIAGFATETERDFCDSLSIIEEARFARVHAFAFSPREGTVAYRLPDLPAEVKNSRLHRLLSAAKDCAESYVSSRIGATYDFIAEEYSEGYTCGYTGNYIRIYAEGKAEIGKKHSVILKEKYKDGAIARLYE